MGSYNGPAGGDLSGLNVDADLNMGAYDLLTDDIKESSAGVGVDIDGVICKDMLLAPSAISKKVSDNLRHSHDAEVHDERADGSTWLLAKTFTMTTGIKGTLRFKFDLSEETDSVNNIAVWAKNSKAAELGAHINPTAIYASFNTHSQDIDVGTMLAGETIEIYTKANNWQGIFVKNARIYYDDDEFGAVAYTTS